MEGRNTASDRPSAIRISESDALLSTSRGPHLSGLMHNRSSGALAELRSGSKQRPAHPNRSISTDRYDGIDPFSRTTSEDVERGLWSGGLEAPNPPFDFPLTRAATNPERARKLSEANAKILMAPQMRSQRLIGNSNPRYRWEQYYKAEKELKQFSKPLRRYYERTNYLVQQYLYIDRLLDSSLPHNLIQDYEHQVISVPPTIQEETTSPVVTPADASTPIGAEPGLFGTPPNGTTVSRVQRDKTLYKVPDEETPLLNYPEDSPTSPSSDRVEVPLLEPEEEVSSQDRAVAIAIYVNFAANASLLIMKIIVTVLTSSLSVLASLVDAALDFLSTFIVWSTTLLIARAAHDSWTYPAGRRRLEPVGVLVFSVVMITAFVQVSIQAIQRLSGSDHTVVQLTIPSIAIMLSTVIIKGLCWFYCRLIKNSGVQALAQDAVTDVWFNAFSIVFPLIGFWARVWWLDPAGGLVLPLYVIISWSFTARTHILNLTGHVADADERNVLLYLTMRFAHTIKKIQSLTAYHAGDHLMVEVDIVVDAEMPLRDSHDLGESLQYVLESVPGVERAFVHSDYLDYNLPSHMRETNK